MPNTFLQYKLAQYKVFGALIGRKIPRIQLRLRLVQLEN